MNLSDALMPHDFELVQASLRDVNLRCPEEIQMDRFRPNIIVKHPEAWEEDEWEELRIGNLDFVSSMPTGRCTVCLHLTSKPGLAWCI